MCRKERCHQNYGLVYKGLILMWFTWSKVFLQKCRKWNSSIYQPRSESETKWRLIVSANKMTVFIKFPVYPLQLHPFHTKLDVFKFHGRKVGLFPVLAVCFSTSPYKSLPSEQEVNLLGIKEVRLRYFTAVRLLPKVIPPFQFNSADTLEITQKKFIIHETGVASLSWNSIFGSKACVL